MLRADLDNGIYSQYVAYFEDFCTQHIDIQHTPQSPSFVGPDVDNGDFVKNLGRDVIGWLSPPEFDGSDPDSDNEMLYTVGRFFILKKVHDKKFADISTAKNFCLLIALDLVAKMFDDKKNTDNQLTAHFTKRDYSIDPGSAENLDTYYGVQITIRFKALINLELNPARFI